MRFARRRRVGRRRAHRKLRLGGMHKAILFDLGRVLIDFDFRRGYRALEGLCPYAAEEIPRRLAGTGLVERFETGLVEPREFVDQMCRILDLQVDYDQFRGIWSSIFTDVLLPESLLEGLGRRYRLVLVSNTNALHFEMIRETYGHLLRHFDDLVLSYEVHAMRSEEHTSELQSLRHLVCRLLLEKK